MQTNKTIRIFLSSAIDELKDERDILSDYIFNTISPIFSKNGIEIELFKMDDIDWGYAGKPSQNAVDDYIKKCDICIFIFKQKINNETIHEYNKAHELQNTEKQSIFVYYFDESEDKKSHDLTAFLNQLKEDRNRIYWTVCKDIDTMKSHFLFSLLKNFMANPMSQMSKTMMHNKTMSVLLSSGKAVINILNPRISIKT